MGDIDFKVKAHNRISRTLHKDFFFKVEGDYTEEDYVISERFQDEDGSREVFVNISQIIGFTLDKERYDIFKYGKDETKEESSCFYHLKGQDFGKRKADITLLIYDKVDGKVILVCGEVKKTLKYERMADARSQLISSYIDLNIFNALLTFNYFPVERIFFIAYEQNKLPKHKPTSASALLMKDHQSNPLPYALIEKEYKDERIYFSLDHPRLIAEANKDVSRITDQVLSAKWLFVEVGS